LSLGKGGATWEHAQEVDPFSLDNMGALESLDDPIDTPSRSHDDSHERAHKARGASFQETKLIDGCTRSTEGCDDSVECGFMKGYDTPKRHDISHK
jgi:hypothetical protein